MSNPLIRPGDPRFQRPPLTDGEGKNRFADDASAEVDSATPLNAASPKASESLYAPSFATGGPTYRPEYESGQPSRQRLIASLTASSFTAVALASLTAWIGTWYVYPMLLIAAPASGLAWYTAADELSVIRRGGLDAKHRALARFGLIVGIFCSLLSIGLLYAAIQRGIGFDE